MTLESLDERRLRTYYLLRVIEDQFHLDIAWSEFACQSALHRYIPTAVYRPEGWGSFVWDSSKSLFLTCFRDFDDRDEYARPNADEIVELLCTLNQHAQSPWNNRFGFDYPTFNAKKPQYVAWSFDWKHFFLSMFRLDISALLQSGVHTQSDVNPWEFRSLAHNLEEEVVPRLLDPLQAGGEQSTRS